MSSFERPKDEKELQEREATGIIRASRFVRRYAHSKQLISIDIIYKLHKKIFENARPEIAGRVRSEDVEIRNSQHKPPHYSRVVTQMNELGIELGQKVKNLETLESLTILGEEPTETDITAIENIIHTAAWLHHKITYIHPFVDGNGRTARLVQNLILERYGLIGISIKIGKENKNAYCNALKQIDKHNDYEPLMEMITNGLVDRYNGVTLIY